MLHCGVPWQSAAPTPLWLAQREKSAKAASLPPHSKQGSHAVVGRSLAVSLACPQFLFSRESALQGGLGAQ